MAETGAALTAERGAPFTAEFLSYDDDAMAVPSNLAGWRAVFQVRTRAGASGRPILAADSADADGRCKVAPPDPDTGAERPNLVQVALSGADTLDGRADPDAVYELLLVKDGDPASPIPLVRGTFELAERVAVP